MIRGDDRREKKQGRRCKLEANCKADASTTTSWTKGTSNTTNLQENLNRHQNGRKFFFFFEETTEERQHRKLFVWNYSCLTFIVIKLLLSGNIERVSKYALYPTLIRYLRFVLFRSTHFVFFTLLHLSKKVHFLPECVCVYDGTIVLGLEDKAGRKRTKTSGKVGGPNVPTIAAKDYPLSI